VLRGKPTDQYERYGDWKDFKGIVLRDWDER
jgi:hypothetical protein